MMTRNNTMESGAFGLTDADVIANDERIENNLTSIHMRTRGAGRDDVDCFR
jgi:hypothetical protein